MYDFVVQRTCGDYQYLIRHVVNLPTEINNGKGVLTMPKYKLLPVQGKSTVNAPPLYIVVAQEDFIAMDGTFIPCGTEGGFVESEACMPNTTTDKSWIYATDGYVVGNAKITNSVIRHGYVSGNAVIENSIIDKKCNIMENAVVVDSTVDSSVIGVCSRVVRCRLIGDNCINLYENTHILDSTIKDSSISGNILIWNSNITNCAIHNTESKCKSYEYTRLSDKTELDSLNYDYRDKHGTGDFARRNRRFMQELERAKEAGELRAGYDIANSSDK